MSRKVSIIIPVYNTPQEYLNRCIDSVLTQTFKDIEILVIDDGSDSKCAACLDSWGKRDSRILLYHIPNGGVSHARNFALIRASGEYIFFVDSDDMVPQNWLKFAVELADQEQADAVFGIVKSVMSDEKVDTKAQLQHKYYVITEDKMWQLQCGQFVKGMKKNDSVFEAKCYGNWGKLFRKSVIEGEYYAEDMCYGEDQLFNHQLMRHFHKVIYSTDISYFLIRDREDSATNTYNEQFKRTTEIYLNRIKDVLTDADNRTRNAFYLQVLSRADAGAFHTWRHLNDDISVVEIYTKIREMLQLPLFKEALLNADASVLCRKNWLRIELLKHHGTLLFAIWDKLYFIKHREQKYGEI